MLDTANGSAVYSEALETVGRRLDHPGETPSARILAAMRGDDISYFQLALRHAGEHREYYTAQPFSPEAEHAYREMAAVSLRKQRELEQGDRLSFEDFLARYYRQHAL